MNIPDNILEKKVIINGVPYINGEVLLSFLQDIFSDVNDGYTEDVVEKLSYNTDILLEVIEYNDGEGE